MKYLPPEVWDRILCDLSLRDMANLPFTIVHENLPLYKAKQVCYALSGTLTYASLHDLTRVAFNPVLGQCVARLKLGLQLLLALPLVTCEHLGIFRSVEKTVESLSMGERLSLSRKLVAEQAWIQGRGLWRDILTALFCHLPALEDLVLEFRNDDIQGPVSERRFRKALGKHEYQRFLTIRKTAISTAEFITTIFRALIAADTALVGFSIKCVHSVRESADTTASHKIECVFEDPDSEGLKRCCRKLKRLGLHNIRLTKDQIFTPEHSRNLWLTGASAPSAGRASPLHRLLTSLTGSSPQLEELDVAFDRPGDKFHLPLMPSSNPGTFGSLRGLQLANVLTTEQDLVGALTACCSTLKSLDIYFVHLLRGTWQSALWKLKGKLPGLLRGEPIESVRRQRPGFGVLGLTGSGPELSATFRANVYEQLCMLQGSDVDAWWEWLARGEGCNPYWSQQRDRLNFKIEFLSESDWSDEDLLEEYELRPNGRELVTLPSKQFHGV